MQGLVLLPSLFQQLLLIVSTLFPVEDNIFFFVLIGNYPCVGDKCPHSSEYHPQVGDNIPYFLVLEDYPRVTDNIFNFLVLDSYFQVGDNDPVSLLIGNYLRVGDKCPYSLDNPYVRWKIISPILWS